MKLLGMAPPLLLPFALLATIAPSPAHALCPPHQFHLIVGAGHIRSTSQRHNLVSTATIAVRRRRQPSTPWTSPPLSSPRPVFFPSNDRGQSRSHHETSASIVVVMSSSWNDFAYDDEDDVLLLESPPIIDGDFVPADENDDPSIKAVAGMALLPPEVDYFGPIIEVPQGSELALDEETVQGVLAACRQEIGTMFGYQAENRGVGITGGVDFVELDGPTVVLRLKGRFWHQRPTVLRRVGAYLMARIPEIVDVVVDDEYELTDEANNLAA